MDNGVREVLGNEGDMTGKDKLVGFLNRDKMNIDASCFYEAVAGDGRVVRILWMGECLSDSASLFAHTQFHQRWIL